MCAGRRGKDKVCAGRRREGQGLCRKEEGSAEGGAQLDERVGPTSCNKVKVGARRNAMGQGGKKPDGILYRKISLHSK